MPTALQAITAGLRYLHTLQADDGSFSGQSSPRITPFTPTITYHTTFLPALMLGALAHIEAAKSVCAPLAAWVAAQRSPVWSFNYWAVNAPERHTTPYPDDLDDTFCALIGLYRYDPAQIGAEALASIVKLLLAAETQVGGPYRTWLIGPDAPAAWQDVDLAVNCNVAAFLRMVANPLPNLTALMDTAIQNKAFASPYYPTAMPVLYYMARAYHGDQTDRLRQAIHDYQPANALETALRLTALLHVQDQTDLSHDIQTLLAAQQPDGSWPAASFCLDAKREGRRYYHGAAALTTAFALEALQAFHTQTRDTTPKEKKNDRQRLVRAVKQSFSTLPAGPRRQLEDMTDHMAAHDSSGEIFGLPQLFATSLQTPVTDKRLLSQLSIANACGWMAYTIYDNLQDKGGQPELLPIANIALRKSVAEFQATVPDIAYQTAIHTAFTTIDCANSWEVTQCRATVTADAITVPVLPRYGNLHQLADRSLGHVLSPLAILTAAGHPPATAPARHILSAFRHYLIARQLLDDLQDWEEDLHAGCLTAVVVRLLRQGHIPQGSHSFDHIIPSLSPILWQRTLPAIGNSVTAHLETARSELQSSGVIRADAPLFKLLDRLQTNLQTVQTEQADAATFLAAYKKPLA